LNRSSSSPGPTAATELDDFGILMALPDAGSWIYALQRRRSRPSSPRTADPQNPYYTGTSRRNLGAERCPIMLDAGGALQDLRWPEIDGPPQIGPENLCVGCEDVDGGRRGGGHACTTTLHDSGPGIRSLRRVRLRPDRTAALRRQRCFNAAFSPDPNPSKCLPEEPPSFLYEVPSAVQANDADRTLTWSYAAREIAVGARGVDGWSYLVSDPSDPINSRARSWTYQQAATALR